MLPIRNTYLKPYIYIYTVKPKTGNTAEYSWKKKYTVILVAVSRERTVAQYR